MGIEKKTSNDSIEVSGQYKIISVKKITEIIEDGNVISASNERCTYMPNDDISGLDSDIVNVANMFWTQEVKDNYKAYVDSQLDYEGKA